MPHLARNDILSMVFQMPHRKQLDTALDSVHIHFIPLGTGVGDLAFSYEWGWYKANEVVPATLPNTNSLTVALVAEDQYKLKLASLITALAAPTSETYSSLLYVKCTRRTTGDTWGTDEIALAYMDAHYLVDRYGSYNEITD